jgi:hypothetical protein
MCRRDQVVLVLVVVLDLKRRSPRQLEQEPQPIRATVRAVGVRVREVLAGKIHHCREEPLSEDENDSARRSYRGFGWSCISANPKTLSIAHTRNIDRYPKT